MRILREARSPTTLACDILIVGVGGSSPPDKIFQELNRALQGALATIVARSDFTGKHLSALPVFTLGQLPASCVLLLGMGKLKTMTPADLQAWAASAVKQAGKYQAKRVGLVLPTDSMPLIEDVEHHLLKGFQLGTYRIEGYKSKSKTHKSVTLSQLIWLGAQSSPSATSRNAFALAHRQATIEADAIKLARDLVNMPPDALHPQSFAQQASRLARQTRLRCQIWDTQALKRHGMGLHLAVGAGSARPPCLVQLHYTPKQAGKSAAPVALVGKGITFDSGGLCIKPAESMLGMKMDMAGAAVVLATMVAAAKMELPIPLVGFLALAENMPSGTAYRPNDIVRAANGKMVEIINTDAEGRLVLADSLHVATTLQPACIVDLATLTGACMIALGPHTAGLYCNHQGLLRQLEEAAEQAGESVWHMPLLQQLAHQLDSDIADMKHTGERYGGSITAALFLQHFVGQVPWAHFDIAGPALSSKETPACPKGGTGMGVATLLAWLRSQPSSTALAKSLQRSKA